MFQPNDAQKLEDATDKGDYEYWLSEEDISDIARVKYRYNTNARPGIALRVISENFQNNLQREVEDFIKNNEGKEQKKSLTMIINVNNNHWVALVVSYQESTFSGFFADSFGRKLSDYTIIDEIMKRYSQNISVVDVTNAIDKQQKDSWNCGLWALENAAGINQMLQKRGDISKKLEDLRKSLTRLKEANYFQTLRKNLSEKLKIDPDRRKRYDDIPLEQNRFDINHVPGSFLSEPQKAVEDYKKNDLMSLYNLFKELDSANGEKDVIELLQKISKTFSSLYRNNQDEECIRNIYGKRNYSKGGKENSKHIDFDQLSFLTSYPDEQVESAIAKEISGDVTKFSAEFGKLKNNIGVILKKELLKKDIVLDDDNWDETKKSLLQSVPSNIENLELLPKTVSYYFDQRFIKEMSSEEHINRLKSVNKSDDPIRWRYTLARILTILGEVTKNLSDDFRREHAQLPWSAFYKIRDQLAHVHHKYVVKSDEKIESLYSEIAENGLATLKIQLESLTDSAGSSKSSQTSVKISDNIFIKLLNHFSSKKEKKPEKEEKSDGNRKIKWILNNIENEIQILENLVLSNTGTRDYAYEYCLGVIGQLFRDIKECKNDDVEKITGENLTVQEAIKSTVTARNKKIMHDPLNDNTDYLINLMEKETLPMLEDIKAIAKVVDNRTTEQMIDNFEKIHKLTNIYRNLGWAFYRLNMIEAKDYFKKALESTYPEFYAKHVGVSQPVEILEVVIDAENGLEDRIQKISENNKRYFIQQINKKLLCNRVVLKYEIVCCLLREHYTSRGASYEEAKRQCDEAVQIINKYKLFETFNRSEIIILFKFKIMTASPDEKCKVYNEYKNQIKENDYKSFAEITQNYSCTLLRQGNDIKALEIINSIDLNRFGVKLLILRINVYATKGVIYLQFSYRKQLSESISDLEKAAEILEEAHNLIEDNLKELKSQQGDNLRFWREFVSNRLALSLGNLASKRNEIARLPRIIPNEDSLLHPINKAIDLQEKHNLDTSVSYLTRAAIYETLYSKTYGSDYLKKAVDDYTKITTHENLKHRAVAHIGLSSCCYGQFQHNDAISHGSEAMLYYSEVSESDKDDGDKKDEIEIIQFLERARTDMKENLKAMLEVSYEMGGKHKNEPEKAAFYYKKSLVIYNYLLEESVDMKSKIKHALIYLFNCNGIKSDKFFTYFPNIKPVKKILEENTRKLFAFIKQGEIKYIRTLIKNGVYVNFPDENQYIPLFWAIYSPKNSLEIVKILIENGCNVNIVDEDNWSPLHYASQSGCLDIVEELVKSGCDINLINKEYKTPLDCAIEKGHENLINFLVQRGARRVSVKVLFNFESYN